MDTLWTVQDVARFLRCSTRHVCRLRRDLGLPAIRLGPSVRFKPDHVMAWVEECRDQLSRRAHVHNIPQRVDQTKTITQRPMPASAKEQSNRALAR